MSREEDDAVETFEHANRRVRILRDDAASSPRENDNLATLACWHRRSKIGDVRIEPCSEEELRDRVGGEDVLALLPIYLYEHGGMTVSTTPFGCSFDSGQVGWAYVTRDGAERMGCVGDRYEQHEPGRMRVVGTWDQAALEAALRSEVEELDAYLCGYCYGYVVEGADGRTLESCWGFVGEDLEPVRQEARWAAEGSEDPAVQARADELAGRATYAGSPGEEGRGA